MRFKRNAWLHMHILLLLLSKCQIHVNDSKREKSAGSKSKNEQLKYNTVA